MTIYFNQTGKLKEVKEKHINLEGNIGIFYQKKGNIKKAKSYYKQALFKDPNNEVLESYLQMLNGKH